MPFNTLSVATAVTPSVIETYFSHFLNRGPLKHKPTAHISYHEGLRLIRQFLEYSSKHSVEDLQAFTAQWVPAPTWVRIYDSEIAPQFLEGAARLLQTQLGRRGLDAVGGKTWWQWRRPETPMRAEWIEMKKDFSDRKKTGLKCDKCILYVHGGAYYFGSVDEHRYQMQRHARKLKARVLAPRYRLAPQFPFPCGLHDCIATYLYLLEHFRPDQILFAGDSAGAGMVLSLLVTLRDQGLPLPAGTILLSPWVDLTHSFPSVAGDGIGDFIPPYGFHHKPSMAWPPPQSDGIKRAGTMFEQTPSDAVELPVMDEVDTKKRKKRKGEDGEFVDEDGRSGHGKGRAYTALPGMGENLSIMLDGKKVEIKEQIQLYAPNDLLSHPLVSPAMQPSLGGLPPMLIQVGGAELLRDEQIYIAHKAANPKAYPPGDAIMDEYDPRREALGRYPPTDVQLQVWEDLCHVPHTLSFTRPAKYMYRSVAQFGAWALAHAQHRGVDIRDNDDNVSIISSGAEDEGEDPSTSTSELRRNKNAASEDHGRLSLGAVGRAGDPIPAFRDHMIRQRVTRHGIIYNMAAESEIACLALDPASIGTIKQGPVRKWIAKKREADVVFGKDAKKLQKKKARELALGYDEIPGETPPPSALVGRRRRGVAPEEKKQRKNWGLALWSGWGSSHDESMLKREEKAEKDAEGRTGDGPVGESGKVGHLTVEDRPQTGTAGSSGAPIPRPRNGTVHESRNKKRRTSSVSVFSSPWSQKQVVEEQRPRSRPNRVTDTGHPSTPAASMPRAESSPRPPLSRRSSGSTTNSYASRPMSMAVPTAGDVAPDNYRVPGSQNTYLDPHSSRPHNGINAYPFRLRQPASNPSLATLDSKAASTYSARGEGAGTSIAPVEMPTHADPPLAEMPMPANTHIEMPTPADEAFRWPEGGGASEDPVSAIPRNSTPQRDIASTTSRSGTPQREPVSAGSRSGTPQRDPMSAISRTSTPQREIEPVVSPETPPKAMPFRGPAAIFDNRSSLLGAIGADGMPIAPLQGRRANAGSPKASGLTSPHSASSSMTRDVAAPAKSAEASGLTSSTIRNPQSDPRVAASAATEGLMTGRISKPVTPVDGEKPAVFKIRNPVYDGRRAPTPVNDLMAVEKSPPEAPAAPEAFKKPGEATEATKAAPFKLRHTVYDPSPAYGQTPVSRPSDPALPSAPLINKDTTAPPPSAPLQAKEPLQAEQIATRAMTPIEQPAPTHNDLPPNSHVVIPTLVARRPIAMWQNTPPQAPAKDEVGLGRRSPLAIGLDRKRSKELLNSTRDRDRDRKTPSPATTMATTMAERTAAVRANLLPKRHVIDDFKSIALPIPSLLLWIMMDSLRWRCLLATAFALLSSHAAAQSVSAQNATTQSAQQQSFALTMAVSVGNTMEPLAQIIALTRSAALNIPPPGISGQALLANASNQLTIQHDNVALISCDDSAYAGNIHALDVFATAEAASAQAVVWYSTQQDWCNLEHAGHAYNWVYSMQSLNDTQKLLESIGGSSGGSRPYSVAAQSAADGNIYVTIAPPDNAVVAAASGANGSSSASQAQQQQQDAGPLGPSPGTAVAMIILYSITGIITALFLSIIITGAVRAHRHPERYGPRYIMGRARQSRARGLARAMLDTIPIVKFGEREEAKPEDVELADGSAPREVPSQESGTLDLTHITAATTTAEDSAPGEQEPLAGRTSSAGGIAAAASSTNISNDRDNQGCSICTEDFELGQDQRVLPCDHRFHPDCIDPWLLNISGTCPLCRIDLRPQASQTPEGEIVDEHGNPVPHAEGRGDMPPPLGERTSVRRSVVMGLMGIRRPDRMTREERLSALRTYRVQQDAEAARRRQERSGGGSMAMGGGASPQDESGLRTRLRNAIRIRTRRTGTEESGGGGAATAPIADTPAPGTEAG